MDSEGFVELWFIASLKRTQVNSLGGNRTENLNLDVLRSVCQESDMLEYVRYRDIEKVRCREGWKKWVLPLEQRDKSVRDIDSRNLPKVMNQPAENESLEDEHQDLASARLSGWLSTIEGGEEEEEEEEEEEKAVAHDTLVTLEKDEEVLDLVMEYYSKKLLPKGKQVKIPGDFKIWNYDEEDIAGIQLFEWLRLYRTENVARWLHKH